MPDSRAEGEAGVEQTMLGARGIGVEAEAGVGSRSCSPARPGVFALNEGADRQGWRCRRGGSYDGGCTTVRGAEVWRMKVDARVWR